MSWYPAPETDDEREERLRPKTPMQPVSVQDRASTANAITDPQVQGEPPVDWVALEKLGWQQVLCPGCGGDYARARPSAIAAPNPPAAAATINLLAKKHVGMRVDYSGLLRQCQQSLKHSGDTGNAEMLRQLQEHLQELGQRWYAGDTSVVDEILQLYCIEKDARAAHASTISEGADRG